MSTRVSYNMLSKLFHWTVLVLLIGQFALVWASQLAFRSEFRDVGMGLLDLHKTFGLTLLAVVAARLLWRWVGGLPAWAGGVTDWEKITIRFLERWLYTLLIILPAIGVAYSVASGFPVHFFGYFTIPVLMNRDPVLANLAWIAHMLLGYALVALIALHLGFVLRRRIFEDPTYLRRMSFFNRRAS